MAAIRHPEHPKLIHSPRYLLGALFCVLLLPAAVFAADVPERFAGRYVIDRERSDDADDRLKDATRDIARDLRPPRSSRPDPAGLRRPPSQRAMGRDLFGPLRLPRAALDLAVESDAVGFTRDLEPEEQIWTDGRPSVVDADNPDVRIAAWEDGILYVERISDRGTRIVEAWRREADALFADFEIRNGLLEDPVTFTLVFVPRQQESTAP